MTTILAQIVIGIKEKTKRNLSDYELDLIITQVKKCSPTVEDIPDMIKILCDVLRKKRMEAYHKHQKAIKSMESFKNDSIHDETKISTELPKNMVNVNLGAIFSSREKHKILKVLNPSAMKRKAYFTLDRRYQNKSSSTSGDSKFSWNLLYHNGADNKDSIISRKKIKNITGMKMYPFRFPNTDNALTFARRLSVNVNEVISQSFISSGTGYRYHFMFEILEETKSSTTDPFRLNETSDHMSEFSFSSSIQHLETLTLSFGNPTMELTLDPDRLPATIAPSGVQTLLTFSQPHKANDGDLIFIEGFTTNQPNDDFVEISMINNKFGWVITSSTAFTLTIDVDLSGLAGSIINNPYEIYLDGKRFIIGMEIYYAADK